MKQKSKLISPVQEDSSSVKIFVPDSQIFDILNETHISIGHSGCDRMLKELLVKHRNITRHDVKLFVQLCAHCQQLQKGVKKGLVLKPILSSEFNPSCQVDLIDFQSYPKRMILSLC